MEENENIININPHPTYPSLARFCEIPKFWFAFDGIDGHKVILQIPVFTKDPDGNIIDELTKRYDLVASNETKVNQMGVPDPDGVIGEFDFFLQLLASPVVINDMVKTKIQWAASLGRFNV